MATTTRMTMGISSKQQTMSRSMEVKTILDIERRTVYGGDQTLNPYLRRKHMGIDFKKMQQKLNDLTSKGTNNYFKMEVGKEYNVRILPSDDGDPFKSFFVHYRVGKAAPFLSLKRNFNEEDPLHDFVRSLYDAGDEESKKLAKEISAKQRFFSNVIVRGREDEGPMVWSYSKTVYKDLLSTVLDDDYGDITDPDGGFDIKVNYSKPDGKTYPETSVRCRPKSTPLSDDPDQAEEWLEARVDIEGIQNRKTREEVEQILADFVNGSEVSPEENSSETTSYGNTSEGGSVADALKNL